MDPASGWSPGEWTDDDLQPPPDLGPSALAAHHSGDDDDFAYLSDSDDQREDRRVTTRTRTRSPNHWEEHDDAGYVRTGFSTVESSGSTVSADFRNGEIPPGGFFSVVGCAEQPTFEENDDGTMALVLSGAEHVRRRTA